jgi:uncharacterized alpha/beta hydrolase family protein
MARGKKKDTRQKASDDVFTEKDQKQSWISTHKKQIWYSSFTLLAIFILVMGVYFFLVVNLFLGGGVVISLEPEQLFISTDKTVQKTMGFDIAIENAFFCTAQCEYEFKDISNARSIEKKFFKGRHGTVFKKSYTITPPQKGAGQLAFEMKVTCENKKNFLCSIKNSKKTKSSFVTLGYELSKEDQILMESVRNDLETFLMTLQGSDIALQNITNRIEVLPSHIKNSFLQGSISQLNETFTRLLQDSEYLKKLWKEEEYLALQSNLGKLDVPFKKFVQEVQHSSQELELTFSQGRTAVQKLREFSKGLASIEELNEAQRFIQPEVNLTDVFIIPYQNLLFAFNKGLFNNYVEVAQEIDHLQSKLGSRRTKILESVKAKSARATEALHKEVGYQQSGNMTITLPELYMDNTTVQITSISQGVTFLNMTCARMTEMEGVSAETSYFINETCSSKISPLNLTNYNFPITTSFEFPPLVIQPRVGLTLYEHTAVCCIFGECVQCCTTEECMNSEEKYPLVLLHGHAISKKASVESSLTGFERIRQQLLDEGFIDAGTMLPSGEVHVDEQGVLGRFGKPIIIGVTFYLEGADENFYISKNEGIEVYAKRLDSSIYAIKQRTGAKKVNLLAFSMGGLVARQYLKEYGEESVNKLIMIGTPNNGISGKLESFCPLVGARKECTQMSVGSSFMNSINNPTSQPKKVKMFNLLGKGCVMEGGDGDGAVLKKSAEMSYSLNFDIEGSCTTTKTLHEELRNIDKYPKTYSVVRAILKQ